MNMSQLNEKTFSNLSRDWKTASFYLAAEERSAGSPANLGRQQRTIERMIRREIYVHTGHFTRSEFNTFCNHLRIVLQCHYDQARTVSNAQLVILDPTTTVFFAQAYTRQFCRPKAEARVESLLDGFQDSLQKAIKQCDEIKVFELDEEITFDDFEITLPQAEAGIEQRDSVVQLENTTFTDQRETVTDDGYVTTQIQPNLTKLSMPEEQWHVRNIMAKPIPFWSGDWSTKDTLGTIIKQWVVPGDTLFGPHYNQVSTFTFFRGHPTIRFQINGTKFHAGRLIAAFIPAYQYGQYDDVLYSVSNLVSLPHVILDASIANSGVITLPFVHMNTYFNTITNRAWQSLGTLVLSVFNRLGAATSSSQTVGVTAWVHYENCELHQPCYAHEVQLPKTSKAYAESGIEGLVKSVMPMVKDLITPEMTAIGDVLGGAADLDKPSDPVEIQRWVPNVVSGLSWGEGIDRSNRLCLVPGSYTVGDADIISTTRDDMDLKELCMIPVRLDLFDWKDTQNTGKRLTHIPICPNLFTGYSESGQVKPPVQVITPTLLSYISRYFKFWRGSLRYKVQIIASQMHTGRLMISYGAGLNLAAEDFAKASYLNTYTVDLQEKHEVEFVVPFLAERPWLRCDRFRRFDETATEISHDNWENVGYLDIYVLNRLSHPDSVPSAVSVNVFIAAGEDFELAFPSELDSFQGIGNVVVKPGMPKAEAEYTVTSRTHIGDMTLTKGDGKIAPAGPSTMSENSMNLKTLLRRYTKVFTVNGINIGDAANFISFANSPDLSGVNKCFNNDRGAQCRTALAHFSQLFTFWRGSLRYKLVFSVGGINRTSNVIFKVFHMPGVFNYGNFSPKTMTANDRAMFSAFESMGTAVAQSGVQGSLEFEIPFYTPYTQLRTFSANVPNSRQATGLVFITFDIPETNTTTKILMDLYQAGGDDFTLNYLRAAPRVQFVRGYDTERRLEDNALFIHTTTPQVCADVKKDPEEEVPKAEALFDYIPGVSTAKTTLKNLNNTSIKVESVCDTANHVLLQASKKLGLSPTEEDEEETASTTLFQDASSLCSPIMPVLESLIAYLKMLPNNLASYLKPEVSATDIITEVANLVSGFTAYSASWSFLPQCCAVITIVTTLLKGITIQIKNSLYHFVSQVFTTINGCKQGNQQPQAESSAFDLVAPLTATLAVALGAIGFKKIPDDKATIDLCRGISDKLRLFNFSSTALSNVKGLWTQIKDLMQWCIEYIMGLLAPHLLAQLKLSQEFENIDLWAKFIDSLENVAYTDKIHYDYEFRNKVYRAIDAGKKYNTLLLEGRCGRAASVIREYVRKITEIGLHCEKSKNELPFRKDPYCVAMCGDTDIGKSGCITTAAFDVMDHLGYPLHNRWCAINCTEKYFSENYRQQSSVYFDDFSTFTTEEQYQKFFNLKANTAFPLDMAFRKGEYFNSDFIWMTTNNAHPRPNFIASHDALLRRRNKLVQAAWSDDEDIQTALREGRSMARYRRFDNTHLKFRFLDPRNEDAVPGPWMGYMDMCAEIIVDAEEHIHIQQTKLTTDLTRAGYIVPQAEVGEVRRVCKDACAQSPTLRMFDPELWQHLTYDFLEDEFELFATEAGEWNDEWTACMEFHHQAGLNLQDLLKACSYEVKEKISITTKIKSAMSDFKKMITDCVADILLAHPWIAIVGKWSLYLTGAFATLAALWFGTKKLVHACACRSLMTYGYRCGFCGKWPALRNVKPQYQQFVLDQWQDLYGNTEYKDYHITTLQEEAALLTLKRHYTCELKEPYIGTRPHAEAIYSDITKGKSPQRITAQGSTYNDVTKGASIVRVTAQGATKKKETAITQKITAESTNTETLISSRVFPYLYRVRTYGKVGLSSMSVNAYAIGQRWVLINSHFFHGLESGDLFEIHHNGAWMPIEYREERGVRVPNKDLIIYDMPMQFHAHKDNTKHFISEKELGTYQSGTGALCKLDATLRAVLVEGLKVKALKELKFELTMNGVDHPLFVQQAWTYPKCSSFGDCGSPLIAYSDKLSGKILGIHIASDANISYSQLVTREMLEHLITRHDGTPIPVAEGTLGNLIPSGHLGRIGKVKKGREFYQSPKTEIVETAIHGIISRPTTFPAVLSINDERLEKRVNPLRKGIEKYSFCSMPFPLEDRQIVNEMMKDEVRLFTRIRAPRPLTLLEACNGIAELEGYERLPRNTSPGYPWILTRPKGACGKEYLFDEDAPIFALEESIRMREEKAREMERVESVWVDCLKDERRPLAKIQQGSTRVFTIPPVDFSILMRKYTLDFSVAVKDSRSYMDCKVGMDPQSLEWTSMYYWLAEFSTMCVAGDFARFDGSMPADLIDDVREDIDHYYETFGECSQEDKNVRKTLFDELIHTVHIARDELYMTHIGNKSGNPITVILNSRINKRYMALAWLGLARKFQKWNYFSMSSFTDNVRMATYGDDNLLSIKQEVLEWYNQETISEYLALYKIEYTNEEKTGITKFKKLDECSFLKQTFHNHDTISMIKVPHMKQQTILELLNWTRVAPDQDQLLFDNCNDALRFSYFYGIKYFNQMREKIIAALITVDRNWMPKTYMDFHLWFLVTIGALKGQTTAEGFLVDLAHSDTPTWKRVLQGLTLGPMAYLITKTTKIGHDDGRIRNDRKAVCIPSGEGKTWLCENYPHLFVDHDDITLPALEKEFQHLVSLEKWAAVGNSMLNPQRFEVSDPHDNRILLTHHPNTTNRTILGKYVLPHPNFNRNNLVNRLMLHKPQKMPRDERNAILIALASREISRT